MNYNSLSSMLNTIENMEVLIDNTKIDERTDKINGVDWFKFNGVIAKDIYVNSNSWVGFGTNSAQLKICNRDGAVWYMYREVGTLYNYFKFLKIRWEGYTYYSSTNIQYALIWELFLFDNGDMFLNVIQVPTNSSYLGTSTIISNGKTVTLQIELGTPVMISFYHDDENGISWTIKKELLEIPFPFNSKYLIRSNNQYYTFINDKLEEISIDTLNAGVFKTYGFEQQKDYDFINNLTNPELLNWVDTDIDIGTLTLLCEATPIDQIMETISFDITDSSIYGIENISTDSEKCMFRFSFNEGLTYEVYKDGIWKESQDEWMTKEEMILLSNNHFNLLSITEYLIQVKLMDDGYLNNIIVKYRNGE